MCCILFQTPPRHSCGWWLVKAFQTIIVCVHEGMWCLLQSQTPLSTYTVLVRIDQPHHETSMSANSWWDLQIADCWRHTLLLHCWQHQPVCRTIMSKVLKTSALLLCEHCFITASSGVLTIFELSFFMQQTFRNNLQLRNFSISFKSSNKHTIRIRKSSMLMNNTIFLSTASAIALICSSTKSPFSHYL